MYVVTTNYSVSKSNLRDQRVFVVIMSLIFGLSFCLTFAKNDIVISPSWMGNISPERMSWWAFPTRDTSRLFSPVFVFSHFVDVGKTTRALERSRGSTEEKNNVEDEKSKGFLVGEFSIWLRSPITRMYGTNDNAPGLSTRSSVAYTQVPTSTDEASFPRTSRCPISSMLFPILRARNPQAPDVSARFQLDSGDVLGGGWREGVSHRRNGSSQCDESFSFSSLSPANREVVDVQEPTKDLSRVARIDGSSKTPVSYVIFFFFLYSLKSKMKSVYWKKCKLLSTQTKSVRRFVCIFDYR